MTQENISSVIDAPATTDMCSVPEEQQSPPIIVHLTQQLIQEINGDQVTYRLVEEGTTCDPAVQVPMNVDESSTAQEQGSTVNDPVIENHTVQVETVTYQIIEKGTRRAKAKLVDSNGYTYNIKTQLPKATYWQCSVRPKLNHCRATVVQRGDVFQHGHHAHNHYAKVGAAAAGKIAALVKQEAMNSPLKSASAIVNEVLMAELGDSPLPSFIKPDCLARTANRVRQFSRPQDPSNLTFEVQEDHLPAAFYKGDILKQGRRHLIFATDDQLRLLRKAKSWYIDQAFKFCQEPFKQLLTISAFVSSEDDVKQVPLVFVLMSGSEKKDYRKVMKKILALLPSAPSVRQITAVFEQVLWSVLQRLFPNAAIKGCVFHWNQAAWRTIQELELQKAYNSDKETNLFLRKVLSLPFLPQDEIQPMFVRLWVQATTAPLQLFIQYISTAWIYNTTWPPSTWSVFLTAVRTYKDVKGWQHSLSRRLAWKKQLPLYVLITLLHEEASYLTDFQGKPLSEKKVRKARNQRPRTTQAKLCHVWTKYNDQAATAAQLLKLCAESVTGTTSM